jgi:phosphatidate cytidylyltransferase
LNKRYLGVLILAPLVVFIFLGGIYLKYGVMLLSIMGLFEFYRVSRVRGVKPLNIAAYLLTIFYYYILNTKYDMNMFIPIALLLFLILLCLPVINVKFNYFDIAITIFGFLYISILFSTIPLVNAKEYGTYLVWFIFISSWICDTAAYYTGRLFGRRKLCPKVSPKKTVEGSVGGILGSVLGCVIYGFILNHFVLNIPMYHYFAIGLLAGVLCQFGDLTASSIKRNSEVKDFSNLIPGHGGILDRFDSILFAGVVVYYYITFIIGI